MSDTTQSIKCVVVGDNGVGKTTLLIQYTANYFCPPERVPIVFDNYSTKVRVGDQSYDLGLWDTYKPEEHDRLRQLSYPGTDVLLVCFSGWPSFENVEIWLDEIQYFCPGVPWLLIRTRVDLRNEQSSRANNGRGKQVTREEGHKLAKRLGAVKYIECSALEKIGVEEVFEEVPIPVTLSYSPTIADHISFRLSSHRSYQGPPGKGRGHAYFFQDRITRFLTTFTLVYT
ncbi:small GTPase Cdc42 [Penicillium cosmopolitanum]|uniref:Small GTPase Cdc42 n=1 Tax=Penicillium cosmopolitanum TaxID=1131564 RepID=A0A9X0BFB6_9EURO|nr:small GTPase Cdc42 [Penicillium cosmopolitanum]KAJ5414948.1 small GTPase Cdc42 [Penicillium cosmopolitanum]